MWRGGEVLGKKRGKEGRRGPRIQGSEAVKKKT